MSKSTLMLLVAALVALFLGSAGILWYFGGNTAPAAQVAGSAAQQVAATQYTDFGVLVDNAYLLMWAFWAMTVIGAVVLVFLSGEKEVNGNKVPRLGETQRKIAKFCMTYGGMFFLIQIFGRAFIGLIPGRTLWDLLFYYGSIGLMLFALKMSGLAAKLMDQDTAWAQRGVIAALVLCAAYDVSAFSIRIIPEIPYNITAGKEIGGQVVSEFGACIGADCPQADEARFLGPAKVYSSDYRKAAPVVRTRNGAPVQTVPTSNGGNQTQAVQGNAPTAGQPSSQQNPAGTPANDGGNTTGGTTYEIPEERGSAFPFWMIMGFLGVVTLGMLGVSAYRRVFEPIGLVGSVVVCYLVTTTAVGGIFFGGDLAAVLRYDQPAYQRAQLPNAHVMTAGKVPTGLDVEPWVVVMCGPHEGGKAEVRVGHGAFNEHLLGDMRAGDVQISPAAMEGSSHWVMPIKADGFVREMAQGYPRELLEANKGVGPCHHYLYANPRVKIVLQCLLDRGGYAPGVERDCGLVIN